MGVGARASATKSQIVKSVSWPTPDTIGMRRFEHRARHDLLVERPQVLDRSAAARDDQHVDFGARVRRGDRLRDLGGGALALHRGRIEDHGNGRPPAPQRRQDVAERRGAQRRHDADGARKRRQRALALRGEPAGRREPRFQALESLVQRADAGEAHGLDVELELAARFVDRCGGADLDGEPVLQRESGELGLLPEEHAAHLRRAVLQIEIAVARGGAREIGDFARHPDEAQMPLDDESRGTDEKAHRYDRRRAEARRRAFRGDRATPSGRSGDGGEFTRRPPPSGLTRCTPSRVCPGQKFPQGRHPGLRQSARLPRATGVGSLR